LIEETNPNWIDLYDDMVASLKKTYGKMSEIWDYKRDE